MNRRGFLKAAAAPLALPAAGVFPMNLDPGLLSTRPELVDYYFDVHQAAGVVGARAAGPIPNLLYVGPEFRLWEKLDKMEEARQRWYHLWRAHRVRLRRRAENPLPATIVWNRDKLRRLRRIQHELRRTGGNVWGTSGPSRAKGFYRRRARFINAFKVAGLPPPWLL